MGEKRKNDKMKMKKPIAKKEKHMDKKKDIAMMKRAVKKDCMK